MKKSEKIRRINKAVMIHYYEDKINFDLMTIQHGYNTDGCLEAIRINLRKLVSLAKPKLQTLKKFYCVECKKVSQHKTYSYISRPFIGFSGGWDQDYTGLKCKNCGHEITEYTLYWIGLKLK